MMHASKEMLVALVDGELEEREHRWATRHVLRCADCAATLAELRETAHAFVSVLGEVDGTEPPGWSAKAPPLEAIGSSTGVRALPAARANASSPLHPRRGRPAAWRWAAGLLLSGAAAAAILRPGLLDRPAPETAPTEVAEPAAAAANSSSGGISVRPRDGAIDIVLDRPAEGTHIRVVFHPGDEVVVEAFDSPAPAFAAREGEVVVYLDARPATLRVGAPVSLRNARIRVGDDVLAVIRDGRIESIGANRGIVIEEGAEQR